MPGPEPPVGAGSARPGPDAGGCGAAPPPSSQQLRRAAALRLRPPALPVPPRPHPGRQGPSQPLTRLALRADILVRAPGLGRGSRQCSAGRVRSGRAAARVGLRGPGLPAPAGLSAAKAKPGGGCRPPRRRRGVCALHLLRAPQLFAWQLSGRPRLLPVSGKVPPLGLLYSPR